MKILTLCPDCAEEMKSENDIKKYSFQKATTAPKAFCEKCKSMGGNVQMYLVTERKKHGKK